jgi:hypothetical protein
LGIVERNAGPSSGKALLGSEIRHQLREKRFLPPIPNRNSVEISMRQITDNLSDRPIDYDQSPWRPLMRSRLIPFLKLVTPVLAVFLVVCAFVLRPWHQRWGATDAEVHAVLPGDDLVRAQGQVTHAITINAPPEKVWPWLMQIGQDRSGFYSYTPLENLVGCAMPKVERLVPDWTPRAVADTVWFGTPKHFQGQAYMVAAVVEPQKAFVMVASPDWKKIQAGGHGEGGSWGFVLQSVDANHSRLIARSRGGTPSSLLARVVGVRFWDPAHFVMERKMLRTIKRLAEQPG